MHTTGRGVWYALLIPQRARRLKKGLKALMDLVIFYDAWFNY